MPHAWINDASRTCVEQIAGQLLGTDITIRAQAGSISGIPADVVKIGMEIGQIIYIDSNFFFLPTDLLQLCAFVERDFGLRRFQDKSSIPSASARAVETPTRRPGMGECCVDDVLVGNTKNQFTNADTSQKSRLAQEPGIAGSFQLRKLFNPAVVIGKPRQHSLLITGVLQRDQSMGIVLTQVCNAREHQPW